MNRFMKCMMMSCVHLIMWHGNCRAQFLTGDVNVPMNITACKHDWLMENHHCCFRSTRVREVQRFAFAHLGFLQLPVRAHLPFPHVFFGLLGLLCWSFWGSFLSFSGRHTVQSLDWNSSVLQVCLKSVSSTGENDCL